MPGNNSSSGFSTRSRNTCVPGSRPSSGIPGRVATYTSHSSESATPITTPASTPADSTPTIAATEIQKSNAGHAEQPPQLAEVDHPEHDRVDDHGAQNRLGQAREQGREHQQGREDEPAGGQRRRPVSALRPTR